MTEVGNGRSAQLRQWWRDWLGAERDPQGTWTVRPRQDDPRGWQDSDLVLHSFGSALGARLLRPTSPHTAEHSPVVIVPFYETASLVGEPCTRTARRPAGRPTQAYAVELARRGIAALAVPWWFETAVADSPARGLAERYGPPAAAHAAAQDRTALGRSIGDLFLAVDALLDQDWVDPDRIGVHGHSLGGKLALHLAALDERVAAAVAHEPGLGLQHSNWDAPWYLGAHQPVGRDHDELLGLVAPRPFLLGAGGDSDGDHNADLVRRAADSWPAGQGPEVLRHDGGHPLTEDVLARTISWLAEALRRPSPPPPPARGAA